MSCNGKSDSRPKKEKKTGPRVKFDLGPEEMVSHGETEMSQETEKYTEMSVCEGSEVHLETEVAEESGTSSGKETCLNAATCQGTEADQSSQTNKNSQKTETAQQTETKELCMDCRQSYGSGQDNHDFVLRLAIYSDHAGCVRALVSAGADVNHKLNTRLVHDVIISGQDDCLKVLIEAGADVNRNDRDGNTPVMVAARDGRDECLQILIAAGASVNTVNTYGITALHLAALCGQFQCADTLIKAGADVKAFTQHEHHKTRRQSRS